MKFTTAILALAATALAVPTGSPGSGNQCGAHGDNSQLVCCGGLLGLLCNVIPIGGSCGQTSYCCSSDAIAGGLTLININLGCLKLL